MPRSGNVRPAIDLKKGRYNGAIARNATPEWKLNTLLEILEIGQSYFDPDDMRINLAGEGNGVASAASLGAALALRDSGYIFENLAATSGTSLAFTMIAAGVPRERLLQGALEINYRDLKEIDPSMFRPPVNLYSRVARLAVADWPETMPKPVRWTLRKVGVLGTLACIQLAGGVLSFRAIQKMVEKYLPSSVCTWGDLIDGNGNTHLKIVAASTSVRGESSKSRSCVQLTFPDAYEMLGFVWRRDWNALSEAEKSAKGKTWIANWDELGPEQRAVLLEERYIDNKPIAEAVRASTSIYPGVVPARIYDAWGRMWKGLDGGTTESNPRDTATQMNPAIPTVAISYAENLEYSYDPPQKWLSLPGELFAILTGAVRAHQVELLQHPNIKMLTISPKVTIGPQDWDAATPAKIQEQIDIGYKAAMEFVQRDKERRDLARQARRVAADFLSRAGRIPQQKSGIELVA